MAPAKPERRIYAIGLPPIRVGSAEAPMIATERGASSAVCPGYAVPRSASVDRSVADMDFADAHRLEARDRHAVLRRFEDKPHVWADRERIEIAMDQVVIMSRVRVAVAHQ